MGGIRCNDNEIRIGLLAKINKTDINKIVKNRNNLKTARLLLYLLGTKRSKVNFQHFRLL